MSKSRYSEVVDSIQQEIDRAIRLYQPMTSPHEAYAIILEEVDEFWDEVKQTHHNKMELGKQLKQVAAMAIRAIHDLELPTC